MYCIEKLHRLPSEVGESGASMFELMLAIEASTRQAEREKRAIEETQRR